MAASIVKEFDGVDDGLMAYEGLFWSVRYLQARDGFGYN